MKAIITSATCLFLLYGSAFVGGCEEKPKPIEQPKTSAESQGSLPETLPHAQTVSKLTTTRTSTVNVLTPPPGTSTTFIAWEVTFGTLAANFSPATLSIDQGNDRGVEVADGFAFTQQASTRPKVRGRRISIASPAVITVPNVGGLGNLAITDPRESVAANPPETTPIPDMRYLIVNTPSKDYFFVTDTPQDVTLESGGNFVQLTECQYVVLDVTGSTNSWGLPAALPIEVASPTDEVRLILKAVKDLTGQSFYGGSCNGLDETAPRSRTPNPAGGKGPALSQTSNPTVTHKTLDHMWINIDGTPGTAQKTWAFGANVTTPPKEAVLTLTDLGADLTFDESLIENGFAFSRSSDARPATRTPRIRTVVGSFIPGKNDEAPTTACGNFHVLTVAGEKNDYIFVPKIDGTIKITLTNGYTIELKSCQWTTYSHSGLTFESPQPLPKESDSSTAVDILKNVKVKTGVSYFSDPSCGCP